MNRERTVLDEFEQLVAAVLDGAATEEELARFNEIAKAFPEFRSVWLEQVRLHALLVCRGGGAEYGGVGRQALRQTTGRGKPRGGSQALWRALAAAAALFAAAMAVWRTSEVWRPAVSRRVTEGPVPPVRVVRHAELSGFELPPSVPGEISLAAGEVTVRLASGVEMTLLGPAVLEVADGMRVRLGRGRVLVNVPAEAEGFIVQTADFDVCDLGTVFGVAVLDGGSDAFVFKGRVRVNDAAGGMIGVCKAGEGVRAVTGECLAKFVAEGGEAHTLFAPVRGVAALAKPTAALAASEKVADLWMDRHMPPCGPGAKRPGVAKAVRFQKKAWVRPTVSPSHPEAARSAVMPASPATETAAPSNTSQPIRVDTSPRHNRHWSTAFTNEVALAWDWPEGAASAELEICGMNASSVTPFTNVTTGWVWRAFQTPSPAEEDVYDIILSFFSGEDAVVQVMTARLAVVSGAFGTAAVDPGPTDRKCRPVREDSVIAYDAQWAASTADAAAGRLEIAKAGGAGQACAFADADGYYGWALKTGGGGYGVYELALSFPGAEGVWDAAVIFAPKGTVFCVR